MGALLRTDAIVGIDPGVTTAVAIRDLHGKVVTNKSDRGFSLRNIVKFLSLECSPLVIASDVRPASRLLEKVATTFSVRVHEPVESLPRRSKSELMIGLGLRVRGRHRKDALAAAMNTYGSMLPMLNRIENRISRLGLDGSLALGYVARKVIFGECNNIDMAVKSFANEHGNGMAGTGRRIRLSEMKTDNFNGWLDRCNNRRLR